MKKSTTILRGLNDIRADYILESELSNEKSAVADMPVRTEGTAPWIRVFAVASTAAALTAIAVLLGTGIMKQSRENPPVVPPVEDSRDAQTSAEEETDGTLATTDETPGGETGPLDTIDSETESNEPTVGIGDYDFVYIPGEAEAELPDPMQNMAASALVGIETIVDQITVESLKGSVRATPLGTFTYSKSNYNRLTYVKGEYGSFYSAYDRYMNDEGTEIRFLQNTDLITYYFKVSKPEQTEDAEEMTPERARAISDAFLSEILPAEILAGIPCTSVYQDSNNPQRYWVGYVRRLHGYNTDEDILVLVDAETGTVKGYNGACVGKYAALSVSVTKEALDRATEKLETEVNSWNLTGLKIDGFEITTNTVGDVYMSMYIRYSVNSDGEECEAQVLLTRVE